MLIFPCIAKCDADFVFFVNAPLKLAQSMKFTADVISISQQIGWLALLLLLEFLKKSMQLCLRSDRRYTAHGCLVKSLSA